MITLIFLIVLFTQGLFYSASEGYILEGLRRFIATKVFRLSETYHNNSYLYLDTSSTTYTIKDNLFKPVWGCIHCMNSFWGVLICLSYGASLIEAIVSIVGAVGVSFIIEKLGE
jgi:hypothetical protein